VFTILRQADLYAPEPVGRRDLLICAGKILDIAPELPSITGGFAVEEVDLSGQRVIPGLVDCHVHITGGGGEDGPASRVPPLALSKLTQAGVTSCIGVLGTDGSTRTMRELVATTLGLRAQGISAWCYTGSYQYPPLSLTGSVRDDIVYVDPIIAVGELAISDHRSSQVTFDEFLRVVSDAYVAGMIAGKSGHTHLHLGDGPRGLDLIRRALDETELPARIFHSIYVNRLKTLFAEAQELSKRGVTVDVTAFPADEESYSAAEAITRWIQADLPVEQITCSSDGAGCLPVFDEDGRMIHMDIGQPLTLIETLRELLDQGFDLEQVLPIFTQNPARVADLTQKGRLEVGLDADLIVLSPSAEITSVMALGQWMVRDGHITRLGSFEG
jgi:beta-aspartyl-dipeptidase (metallo-type)